MGFVGGKLPCGGADGVVLGARDVQKLLVKSRFCFSLTTMTSIWSIVRLTCCLLLVDHHGEQLVHRVVDAFSTAAGVRGSITGADGDLADAETFVDDTRDLGAERYLTQTKT